MFLLGRFGEVTLLKCLNCVCYYFHAQEKFILNVPLTEIYNLQYKIIILNIKREYIFPNNFYLFRKQPQPHWNEFFLGTKPRGIKEAVGTPARVTHRDQEWYDAEIARKLQEEELLVSPFKVGVQVKQ